MTYDVVVVGEPLLEFSAAQPLTSATEFRLSFSGDALNAALAAAAAGAKTALLTRLGRDELSDRLVAFLAMREVDTKLVRREAGQTGGYVLGADPSGTREFAYLRAGSAATRMQPSDVDEAGLAGARSVLLGGIAAALSPSCAATVLHAAQVVREAGGIVIYDPNYRPRLTTSDSAAAFFRSIAPSVTVAIPSAPADTQALFGLADPRTAAVAVRSFGVGSSVITCGEQGVFVSTSDSHTTVPVVPAPRIVDATGAGDCFAGTLTARLALGDDLLNSVRLAMSAASLSLGGQGGTGYVPTLTESREHLMQARLPWPS
jgi:2-dehydro-3-deoxygluconokinase